jgi:hypothetical protein
VVYYEVWIQENSSDPAEKLFVFYQKVPEQAQKVRNFQQNMRIFTSEREESSIRHLALVLPNKLGMVLPDKIGAGLPEEAELKPDRIPHFSSNWMRINFQAFFAKSLRVN